MIITKPKVYLVSRTEVDWEVIKKLMEDESLPPIEDSVIGHEHSAYSTIEIAARMCYMSFGRGRKDIADFIYNLLERKDGSVLEHVNYGFVFTGISRSLSHELVRHRAGFAYSQRSQRYVDEAEANFVIPPPIRHDPHMESFFEELMRGAQTDYEILVDKLSDSIDDSNLTATEKRKLIRQTARSVLPNATETKIFVTANVRAWRHFIELRASKYADREIQVLANEVLQILKDEAPLLFGDFAHGVPKYSKV